ncbi:MAG: hypothetical protein Q8O40_15755 [Chloroflexota bacterium]|nr:hypothetical protein [Chloroflexota bacterium]
MAQVELVRFQRNVAVLTGVVLGDRSPIAGRAFNVQIHWPNGCNGLVNVAVSHGGKQFCPRNGFLALNDALATYEVDEALALYEPLEVEIQNTDAVNAHQITVVIFIKMAQTPVARVSGIG